MKSYKVKNEIYRYTDNLGNQRKFKENGYWYKADRCGCEGLAEEMTTMILDCAVLPDDVKYVEYERCEINGRNGCRSASFTAEGEQNISFQTLYKNYRQAELSDHIMRIPDTKARITFVIDMVRELTGLDVTNYLKAVLTLDAFTRNPDRHFGNLSVIRRSDGTFRLAPIFDNGQALGQNFEITDPLMDYDEKIETLIAAPFSASFEKQMMACGTGLYIDFDKLREKMEELPNSIAKDFLTKQISLYEKTLSIPEAINKPKKDKGKDNIELD